MTAGEDKNCERNNILDIIDRNALAVRFQPIFSVSECKPIGYEALTTVEGYNPFDTTPALFSKARESGVIASLDTKCRENALKEAARQHFQERDEYLFINISPETLISSAHTTEVMNVLAQESAIERKRIILEITETDAVDDFNLFKEAVISYKEAGYRIAIDDFGTGYAGLKMLSIIHPDYVKIDRHFIAGIDGEMMKYNLVDSVAIACHRMGIGVIAEGVELKQECDILLDLGIDLVQGFYFARPSPDMQTGPAATQNLALCKTKSPVKTTSVGGDPNFIGEITDRVKPIAPETKINVVLDMFIYDRELRIVPVVDKERIIGVVHRGRFIENRVIGQIGYGIHLNARKNIGHIMERNFLEVDANTAIEDVSQKVQERPPQLLYDDICITRNGKYYGLAPVNNLLDAITRKSVSLAKGSNPLTGLPGNEVIRREIEKRIVQNMHFDLCYIDLNDFKPYNDHYGFERGDYVIKAFAGMLRDALDRINTDPINFIGHIGGDDFVMITRPAVSLDASRIIIASFEEKLIYFHGAVDYAQGFYTEKTRKGETENIRLLSVSIGILSTEVRSVSSYAHAASLATELKKQAKKEAALCGKSCIVRDRRLLG